MSTSETTSFHRCDCPCGQGKVMHHVTTQDNPWSTADHAYSLYCQTCASQWRIEHGSLILRQSETGYRDAKAQVDRSYRTLKEMIDPIVSQYFEAFGARTKKAELDEILRLNISTMSYRQYLEHRRSGLAPSAACYVLRNPSWLLSQSETHGRRESLEVAIATHDTAKVRAEEADRTIVRKPIL